MQIKSWSEYDNIRKEVPDHFNKYPLIRGSSFNVVSKIVNKKVLDFGANKQQFKKFLKKDVIYKSFDIDKKVNPDYTSFSQIKEKFDYVVAFAVFEHLTQDELIYTLKNIKKISTKLIFTMPNIFSPYWVFKKDLTHKTILSPATIYYFLKKAGYNKIELKRISGTNYPIFKELISKIIQQDITSFELIIFAE